MESSESALIEFFSECDEILQRFSTTLEAVEKGRSSADTISSLYRDMHTLKGSAQLFGFQKTALVAHAIETSLEPIRRLKLQIPSQILDVLFKSISIIEKIIKASNGSKQEVTGNLNEEIQEVIPQLLSSVTRYFDGDLVIPSEKLINLKESKNSLENLIATVDLTSAKATRLEPSSVNIKSMSAKSEEFPEAKVLSVMSHHSSVEKPHDINTKKSSTEPGEVVENPKELKDTIESSDANSTVRIHVGLLDRLMNLVGEMVLVRNQMLQYGQKHDALEFLNLSQRLDAVTSELQGEVMKTRMQPISTILSKFQRVIRDLAKELAKQIELTIQGAETELDKTLLEAIKDPLTHIIRNSCDHGLESPEERIKAGKSALGHIIVRAFHEGGHVIIEVIDDGRGLNAEKILAKALDKRLVSQEQVSKLSERDIMNLIFAPGFSTAEKVTAVSGRGVGMDVVKTNLERAGGQVELQSELGRGMTVRLKIPLTLAIIPALIVRTGGEQFAIPQVKLSELVRVGTDTQGAKVENLQGRPVFRLRGQLLSLVSLKEIISGVMDSTEFTKLESLNIVVLNGERETFGLIVDEIKDTADIVVKPLPHFLKKIQIYSGATIMGDGSVSLILDVTGIAEKGKIYQKTAKGSFVTDSILSGKSKKLDLDQQDFLFFKLNSPEKYCLPLCLVQRLEEFKKSEIQVCGKQKIVKYRGFILPVISLNEFFGLNQECCEKISENKNEILQINENKNSSVIVVQKNSRQYGIEVNEVVDVLTIRKNIEDPIRETNGILGGIIVDEEVATVIDVFGILLNVVGQKGVEQTPDSYPQKNEVTATVDRKPAKILLVEDTVFFMKQVRKLLEKSGYQVTHAPDGEVAWQLLSTSQIGDFDLILSDIEMPHLDGFELADRVRKGNKHSKIPMIALTTKYRDIDREKGREVGFNRYLEKLRSDELLTAIHEVIEEQKNVK